MTDLELDPTRTAVLAMDCQIGVLARYAQDAGLPARAKGVLQAARERGLQVIHVVVGFRPGAPEISPNNRQFAPMRAGPGFPPEALAIHPELTPTASDIVVTKHRVGAFLGTDLEMILRANRVDTLILFGVATSGVVLSTLRHAADLDFRLIVVADCCADADPVKHGVLVEHLFPTQADVVSAADLVAVLQQSAPPVAPD